MTIEELNKIIQEELKAYLNEEQTDEAYHEDGDDDIEVTTDEPEEGGEDEALDTLRQIYNMLKPMVEPEEEEEPEIDTEEPAEEDDNEEETVDESFPDKPTYKASDVQNVTYNAEYTKGNLKEGFEGASRFKKLANIKG